MGRDKPLGWPWLALLLLVATLFSFLVWVVWSSTFQLAGATGASHIRAASAAEVSRRPWPTTRPAFAATTNRAAPARIDDPTRIVALIVPVDTVGRRDRVAEAVRGVGHDAFGAILQRESDLVPAVAGLAYSGANAWIGRDGGLGAATSLPGTGAPGGGLGASSFGASNGTPETIVTSPVPEPSEWAMIASGIAVVGWIARRRKEQ